jgi:hypothetical protein
MPQPEYRLRLAEGTLLVVDHDALSSWVVDDKALVRPPGSKRWRLLKQFLADERAGVIAPRYAEMPAPASVPAPSLALPEAAPFEPPVQVEAFEPDEIAEPALPPSDTTPWEWAMDQAAAAPAPAVREPEPAPQAPVETAAEPAVEIVNEAELKAPTEAPVQEPEIEITVSRLFSVVDAAPPSEPAPAPTPAPAPAAAPAVAELLVEEPPDLEITINKLIPLDDVEPIDRRPSAPVVEAPAPPDPPDIEPVLSEEAAALHASTHVWLPEIAPAVAAASMPMVKMNPPAPDVPLTRASGLLQDLQALADDPSTFSPPSESGAEAPVIRLKPLEPEATVARPESASHEPQEQEETRSAPAVDWGPGLQGAVLRRVAEWSEVLTMRIEKGRQAVRRHGGTRGLTSDTWRDARARSVSTLREWIGAALAMLFAWRELIAGWIAEAKLRMPGGKQPQATNLSLGLHDVRPTSAGPTSARPVSAPVAPPEPRLVPPPGIHSLPTLRFKEPAAPEPVDEDLYDGDDIYGDGDSGLLRTALVWTKRLVLTAGLAAAAFFAFRTQDRWRPAAERRGHQLVDAVGQRLQPRPSDADERLRKQQDAQRQQLLEASASEMPYVEPAIVERVLASMAAGLDDASAPTDVFRRVYEATEHGMTALSPEEAAEWQSIRRTMLGGLPASDRQHITSYERVLRARVSLPYEDRTVMNLLAHAARALPPQSGARLRELSGKAIAAGLARPSTAPAS